MRHHVNTRKFGRKTNQRRALLRSLALNFIKHEGITTTEAKAKELRPLVEKLITRAKVDNVANRRLINSRLGGDQESLVKKLFEEIAPKYSGRNGGYTRVLKLPRRGGDAASMAIIKLV